MDKPQILTGSDRIRAERAEALKQQGIEEELRRRLYGECFGGAAGRKVLLDIFQRSFFFTANDAKSAAVYTNEGARAWALEFLYIIPGISGEVINGYLQQLEEQYAAERKNKIKQE